MFPALQMNERCVQTLAPFLRICPWWHRFLLPSYKKLMQGASAPTDQDTSDTVIKKWIHRWFIELFACHVFFCCDLSCLWKLKKPPVATKKLVAAATGAGFSLSQLGAEDVRNKDEFSLYLNKVNSQGSGTIVSCDICLSIMWFHLFSICLYIIMIMIIIIIIIVIIIIMIIITIIITIIIIHIIYIYIYIIYNIIFYYIILYYIILFYILSYYIIFYFVILYYIRLD